MAGIDNLTPVKPGQILNPNGRPKGSRNRSTIVRELLEALHATGLPNVDVATAEVLKKALTGDVTAWEKLMDSGYGKITDKVEQETKVTINNDVTQKVLSKISTEDLEGIIVEPDQDNQ